LRKTVVIINGSASAVSSNDRLIAHLVSRLPPVFACEVFSSLKTLPHFDPELSTSNPPPEVIAFRKMIEKADGIIICTPEYVFSIPSGLKNAIEWCVSTTVFSGKKVAMITASAHGARGHDELQLIMRTLMAEFNGEDALLIQGIKGKFDANGAINDDKLIDTLGRLVGDFLRRLE
jgi:NAD(P)H-dependent FMN reductase